MFDPEIEQPITLSAARRVSWLAALRDGRPVSLATIYRWVNKGVAGIRLETVTIGGTQFTSRQALRRFVDRVTAARRGGVPSAPPAAPAAEPSRPPPLMDLERARRELELAGIK